MAKAEHVERVKAGAASVAEYMQDHPGILFDLSGADLAGGDLQGMDLRGAVLYRANLAGASLRHANLRSADLRWAVLESCDLHQADCSLANLAHACLRRANLSHVRFCRALLGEADLREANGTETNFTGAILTGAKVHALQGYKWTVRSLVCEWLNLTPDGDDSPPIDQVWRADHNLPPPWQEKKANELILEFQGDASFARLDALVEDGLLMAARVGKIEPQHPLKWVSVASTPDGIRLTLKSSGTVLSALVRLFENAVRRVRGGLDEIDPASSISMDAEQEAQSQRWIHRFIEEEPSPFSSAIFRLAQTLQAIHYRGETFRWVESLKITQNHLPPKP